MVWLLRYDLMCCDRLLFLLLPCLFCCLICPRSSPSSSRLHYISPFFSLTLRPKLYTLGSRFPCDSLSALSLSFSQPRLSARTA